MPSKRQNTTAGTTRKMKKRHKKENPSLNLLLKRLDKKIDQRFDMLDRRIDGVDQKVDSVDQKVDAVDQKVDAVRQEAAVEFKTIRGEMTQGLNAVRSETAQGLDAVRSEMTQGFDSLRRELVAEMKHVSDGAYEHYLRIENERRADIAEFRDNQRRLLTSYDNAAKNYDQFANDSKIIDAEHQDLKRDVETLKKRDMEKAAAIEKIEKEIDKLKAA